jgi:hypothetical protein
MKKPLLLALLCCALAGCELYEYGRLGGADQTIPYYPSVASTNPDDPAEKDDPFAALMENLSGVWYSHWAGIGRLDGYRIGKWEDFTKLVIDTGKLSLIPGIGSDPLNAKTYFTKETPKQDDYFVLYDSSVYGQQDDDSAADPGWTYNFGFCGIVRGVNLFYNIPERGAIIIEYLEGCAPQWDEDIKNGQLPFFGIYYRVLDPDTVQMANAVDLAALYNGEKYYTEKARLEDAMDANGVENEAEYIAWGVVIPQDREPEP